MIITNVGVHAWLGKRVCIALIWINVPRLELPVPFGDGMVGGIDILPCYGVVDPN
jgi:hypothetical protein